MCPSSYRPGLDRGMLCLEDQSMFVEDIVPGETKEVHVVRMRPYADSSLVVGAEVHEVFEITNHQGEFEIADMISVGKDPAQVGEYRVEIAWVGLEDEEPTWEPMSTVYVDAPKYLEQKLRRMRRNSVTKRALKRKYGMDLKCASICSVGLDVVSMDEPSIHVTGFISMSMCLTKEVCVMVHDCRSK